MTHPHPGYLWHWRTELTEIPGTGMKSYRTYRSSGYGFECPTERTEVPCREIPGVNTPGMILYVLYKNTTLHKSLFIMRQGRRSEATEGVFCL